LASDTEVRAGDRASATGGAVPLSGTPRPPASARRRLVTALAQAAAAALLCEAALRAATTRDERSGLESVAGHVLLPYTSPRTVDRGPYASYVASDPDLGWALVPDGRTRDGLYRANAQAIRAPAGLRYAPTPARGRVRVVTVGDSFTHGDGVGVEATWQRALERMRPELEMVNLGVPAYGTDQAYLRWLRDGARLHPHVAVLGIWPENICRNLNVVRSYLQPAEAAAMLSKPRFVPGGRGLQLVNVPALHGHALAEALAGPTPALLRHEYWALPGEDEPRAWHRSRAMRVAATIASLRRRKAMREALYSGEEPAGIALTAAIADAFARHARRAGAVPVVAILPMADLLERDGARPLARALEARGLAPIDLGPPMARAVADAGRRRLFQPDGHLTADGNQVVAGALAARLPQASMAAPWTRHHFISTNSDHGRDQ
jgi:hypothetical protein